jgi:predicted dehydrogenase
MTIRLGILSFAHMHAYSYATCLRGLTGVDLVGIFDADGPRARRMADAFDTSALSTVDALLDQDLDAVIVCSENADHRSLVEAAAPRVANILCEKPIATTIADAQRMIDACAAAGTRLQIAFPVRFSPVIQRLKDVLDDGSLGLIYAVKTTNHGGMPGGWFTDQGLAGGGAVIDHTVHVVDLLRWFWNTEVTEIYAEIGYGLLHPHLSIDDVGMLSFALGNGAYGTLDTSWSRPPSYPTWGDVTIEVVGESGTAWVDAFSQTISVASERPGASGGRMRAVEWGSSMDLGLVQDFLEMVRTERDPSITGYDGLKALEVALGAYQSAERGQPIRLPLEAGV